MLILLSILVVDQVSKSFIRSSINYNDKIEVLDGLVFTHVTNNSFYMNIGEGIPKGYRNYVIALLPFFAIIWLVFRMGRYFFSEPLTVIAIPLILGGGLGNLFDRITKVGVTDFAYIEFYTYKSGIFNIADLGIVLGIMLLIAYRFKLGFITARKAAVYN